MASVHFGLVVLYGVENAGVRYVASALRDRGHEATLVFFKEWVNNANVRPTEEEKGSLLSVLKEREVDVVGISFGSSYFRIACDLAEFIKGQMDVPLVFGGIHATVVPEDCVGVADYVCVGEGEEAAVELADALAEGRGGRDIEGIWSLRDGEPVVTSVRPLIGDLDRLSFPSYGHPDSYVIEHGEIRRSDPLAEIRDYRVYTSRGCLFRCAYCYNSTMRRLYRGKGKYYRLRSPESVLEELNAVRRTNPSIRKIIFDDDVFVSDEEWLNAFLPEYKRQVGLPFECMLHPNMLDEGYLTRLKDAGLCHLQVGIEAGTEEEGRDVYDRPVGQAKILEFAELNRQLKIDIVYDVIIDNPLATERDKRELLEFVLRLRRPFKMFIYSLTAFPKTGITQKLLERGMIAPDEVEGRAEKALTQFRITMDYPRPKLDQFLLALLVMSSKSFVPRWVLRLLCRLTVFERYPRPLLLAAFVCNVLKMGGIALSMLLRGEMSAFKVRQYASVSKMLTQ